MEVLVDNLLVRGFYAYLTGNTSNFTKDCFWQFLESLVIYDKILITDFENEITNHLPHVLGEAIQLANHEEELGLQDNWWLFHEAEEIPQCLQEARTLSISTKNLNYESEELLEVEKLGFSGRTPFTSDKLEQTLLGEKSQWTYSENIEAFEAYHRYFTFYCIQVSHKRQIPYAPNASRLPFFSQVVDIDFLYPDFRRQLLEEFGEIRREYLIALSKYLQVSKTQLEVPLIANYIQLKSKSAKDALMYALELRNAKGAIAFRRYCKEFENNENLEYLLEIKQEVDTFKESLRQNLSFSKKKNRGISINKYGIRSIELPTKIEKYGIGVKLEPRILDRIRTAMTGDHFIFLHDLVRSK